MYQRRIKRRPLRQSKRFVEAVEEVRLRAADRPDLLRALADCGAGGREYVEAVRDAADVPLLALPAR